LPTGTDAERFRGVVDNAAGRRLDAASAAEDPRDTPWGGPEADPFDATTTRREAIA